MLSRIADDRLTQTYRYPRAASILLYSVVALGVFWLPYHVRVSSADRSDSAQVGFNNRVALAVVFAGIGAATILSLLAPRPARQDPAPEDRAQLGVRPLAVACALQTVAIGVMHWIMYGSPPSGESAYFLPRLYFLGRGLTPYRQFEFAYGPAMIYPPNWLARAFGLSIESGYACWFWVFCVAGTVLLWILIREARAARTAKLAAFVILTSWLPIGMALQYLPMRFVAGFGALVLAAAVTRALRRRWYLLPPVYLCLTLLVLSISPEIGCAFIPALLTYLILDLEIRRESLLTIGVYAALMICTLGLLPGELFLVLRSFAAGGNAFPILPSAYVLLYLGSLLTIVPRLLADGFRCVRGGQAFANWPFGAALTIAMAVHTICMVPGALARADVGHVYFYGVGAFLLATLSTWPSGKWRNAYSLALIAQFQVLGLVVTFHFLFPAYRSDAGQAFLHWVDQHGSSRLIGSGQSVMGERRWNELLTRLRRVQQSRLDSSADRLAGVGSICLPFGGNEAYMTLAQRGLLQPEYYYLFSNVFTPEHVQRKLADLRTCTYVLLGVETEDGNSAESNSAESNSDRTKPAALDSIAKPPDSHQVRDESSASSLKWVLQFPWLPPLRDPPLPNPYLPIGATIDAEYSAARRVNSRWILWKKRYDGRPGVSLSRP
ncbi:MAG: hypothetical protein JWP63_6052 [Candidatus Solibacter sp.]|nr:hypothetical protein [Candidatus Solibacter sp.]